MVLESLINPRKAEAKPLELFFIGLIYSSVAMFLSLWIFKDQASLVMVFLTVVASIPLIYHTLKYEEKKDKIITNEISLLKEHAKAIAFFTFLFLGFVVAYSIWFVFLPADITQATFNTQLNTIQTINSRITSGTVSFAVSSSDLFGRIFANNIKVMLFVFLFSFFYGAGAIFILTWNASVIAAAVGTFVRNNLGSYAESVGLIKIAGYFHIGSLGLFRYMIHGIPEIVAYFIVALAGGIISVAVINHDLAGKNFKRIMNDSLILTVLAVLVLFIAALLEVYLTPALF